MYVSRKKLRKMEVKRRRPHKLRALCEGQKGIPYGCDSVVKGESKRAEVEDVSKSCIVNGFR